MKIEKESVIETFACINGKVVLFEEHLKRMRRGMKALGLERLEQDLAENEMAQIVKQAMKESKLREARVRIVVFRDATGKASLNVSADKMPEAGITENGVECVTSRVSWKGEFDFKYGKLREGYAKEREKAEKKGAFDAILVSSEGKVREGCITNVFIVKNGSLATPAVSQGIVAGIARKAVLICAKRIGMKVEEREISEEELFSANEIFLTNAVRGIVAVKKIDGKKIGNGKTGAKTREFKKEYGKMFEEI